MQAQTLLATEITACRRLVKWALEEDLGANGDITSQAVLPANLQGHAAFYARVDGILAGMPAAALVFEAVDPELRVEVQIQEGCAVHPGQRLGVVTGSLRSILAGERTALNFLQRLSGIATRTRAYVEAVAAYSARILDTRKTLPGWRILEKYAVRCGGGHNHRMGLYDAVLIKDNHLAALGNDPAVIERAIHAARARVGHSVPLTVEVDRLDQLDRALPCAPDIVLLDNMTPAEMTEAVRRRNATAPGILLEASGGVNLATVRAIAATGVDRISVGDLTHSAPALDVALDYGG
jgi:nicotinate-nucleotide pyrophosphorylase (carboxylating)